MVDRPNIVLVVFDTARRDRFGCYGYERPTTPTVDSLASRGLRLNTMITNGPFTLPSHGSLFSGLYPSEHGSQWQTGPRMRSSVPITIAEWAKSQGYETVCVTNNGLISYKTGLARGFAKYASRLRLEKGWPRLKRRVGKVLLGGDSGGPIVNQWVEKQLPAVGRPLFLFVNYLECHWSYVPAPSFRRKVGGPQFRWYEGLKYRLSTARGGPWEAIAGADRRTLGIYSALYDAELAATDGHLKNLLSILEGNDLTEDNTLFIVTSDHGEHIGEHGLADHHGSLDDILVRVPFVATGPGIPRGAVKESIVEFVDVLPSLLTWAGAEVPGHLRGRKSAFQPDTPEEAGYAFAEWRAWGDQEIQRLRSRNPSYDFEGLARDLVCVRDLRFKLVRGSDGSQSLFDLENDPAEEQDVSQRHPDVVARMGAALDEWHRGQVKAREDDDLSDADKDAIEEQLAALGYI